MNNITVRPLSPELLDDYLNFFDNYAFIDNLHWAACYCYFPHAPHDSCVWKERTAQENRDAVIKLIKAGKIDGFLAYEDDVPIGWCNAGPRINMTITPDYDEPEADTIGAIVCFIIGKDYRREGIARLLLKTACESFRTLGFKYAEGYPRAEAVDDADNHNGPLDLYFSEGFGKYATEEDTIVVRKFLL